MFFRAIILKILLYTIQFDMSAFNFQYAVHLGIAYALIAFEGSSQGAFVLHAALFHHAAGIWVAGVVNGLDTFHAHLIKEKSDNGIKCFTCYTLMPPFSA